MRNLTDRGYRVLLAHSDEAVLDSVSEFLTESDESITIESTTDPDRVTEETKEGEADCVVSGKEVGDTSGLDLLRQTANGAGGTPFVLFVGSDSPETAREAIEAGAAGHLRTTMPEFMAAVEDPGREQQDVLASRIRNLVDRERMRTNYREMFDKVNDAIFVHDAETGEILDVNERMCEVYGYTREEALELEVEDVLPDGSEEDYTREEAMEKLRKAREEGPQVFEWKAVTNDGEPFWAEVSLKGATISGEERILAVVRDVSERKESEERYRALVEQSLVGIYIIKDGVFEYVNPKGLEMIGAEPEEMLGTSPFDYVHEDDEEKMRENLKKRREGEAESIRYSFRAETFDGEEKVFESHGTRVELTDGPAVAGCIVDITEDVEREERLKAQKEFTEDALDAIQDIFAVFGSDGSMVDWNRTFTETVGYTDEEIESMTTVDFVEGEDVKTVEESIEEVVETGSTSLEVDMITKGGDEVPVRWNGSTLQHPEEGEVICGVGRIK